VTSAAVADLQQKLNAQNEGVGAKVDTVSGQVQSLNDSVDELKSRRRQADKSVEDLQTQLQNIQSQPQPGRRPNNGAMPSGPGAQPSGPGAVGTIPGPQALTAQTPPLQDTYQSGLRDFNAGRYELAAGEFQDVLHYYPLDDLAGSAQFYIGEIDYQQKKYDDAIGAYNAVLEGFSGNPKAPAAQLHKGLAPDCGKQEGRRHSRLRLLIQRHPRTLKPPARAPN